MLVLSYEGRLFAVDSIGEQRNSKWHHTGHAVVEMDGEKAAHTVNSGDVCTCGEQLVRPMCIHKRALKYGRIVR